MKKRKPYPHYFHKRKQRDVVKELERKIRYREGSVLDLIDENYKHIYRDILTYYTKDQRRFLSLCKGINPHAFKWDFLKSLEYNEKMDVFTLIYRPELNMLYIRFKENFKVKNKGKGYESFKDILTVVNSYDMELLPTKKDLVLIFLFNIFPRKYKNVEDYIYKNRLLEIIFYNSK